MRPYGFYWVTFRYAGSPKIAEWTPRGWFLTGSAIEFTDQNFKYISPQRLAVPAEASTEHLLPAKPEEQSENDN